MRYDIFCKGLEAIKFEIDKKSVRDIAKILDNFEDAYRKEKVRITEDFCFLSDTPFLKLFATLLRLGVKGEQLSEFFNAIYTAYEVINNKTEFIKLLGCFAMSRVSIYNNGYIYDNGQLYQMKFSIDKDKYSSFKEVSLIFDRDLVQQYKYLRLDIYHALFEAERHVT